MTKNLIISVLSLVTFCVTPLFAQESCYKQYLREHNMPFLTAEDADDSYDELKKTVLAKQMYGDSYLLMVDTIAQSAKLTKVDGTYVADVHLTLVDSTWYMWLSVDPLADLNIQNSPYMYCNGNPIMLIDPDGKNDYEVDANGNVNEIENNEADNFYWIENGRRKEGISLSFPAGTICNFIQDEASGGEWFEFVDADSAEKLLDFFSQNKSHVEWLHKTGTYSDNEHPVTLLISSKDHSTVSYEAEQAANEYASSIGDYFPIIDNHNHPSDTMTPSHADKTRAKDFYEKNKYVKMAIFTFIWGKSPYNEHGTLDTRFAH